MVTDSRMLRMARRYRQKSEKIIDGYVRNQAGDILVVPLSTSAEPFAVVNYLSVIEIGVPAYIGNINFNNSHVEINKVSGVYPAEKSLEPDRRYKVICVDHQRREDVLETLRRVIGELKGREPIVDALYITVDLFNTTIDGVEPPKKG